MLLQKAMIQLIHSLCCCHSLSRSLGILALLLFCTQYGHSQPVPTRPIDLWNPFGTTTKPRLPGQQVREDEVIVQLTIGNLIGRRMVVHNLPWTPARDPREQIPDDRGPREPNPLPLKNNVTVFTFLGVPYSEAPTGNRRFKPPQRMVRIPGEEPYQAFAFGPSCAQDVETRPSLYINEPYPWNVNEDCLYLNIFTPDASQMSGSTYPVIVFFHGGAFQTGSANDWPGHVLATKGIVVVTVNYRLGAFGFLSLGDSQTGNYGLLDQRLALEWVRDHISSFGGDPLQVTIVGHGAGAVSVGLHMLSPGSTNLFRAAAALSGADVSHDQVITYPALAFNNTIGLGRFLGCTEATAESIWNCIQTRGTSDIVQASVDVLSRVQFNRYAFLPTVDQKVILSDPKKFLENAVRGSVSVPSPVPYLTGVNQNDGTEVLLADRKLGEFNKFLLVDQMYVDEFVLEYAFRRNYTTNREVVADAIQQRYKYWPDPSDQDMIRQRFLELTSDTYYVAPVSLSAHLHASTGSRTFMYVNNYNFSKGALNPNQTFLPFWMGVCHDCDLYLLFGFPWMPKNLLQSRMRDVQWTETDKNASEVFMTIFRQYSKTQNPNFPHDSTWTGLDPRRHWYVDFNYSKPQDNARPGTLRRDYKWNEVAFWNEFIPSLADFFTTTFSPTDATWRRESEVFKVITGVVLLLLMLALVFAGAVSYLLFERGNRSRAREPPLLDSENHRNGNLPFQEAKPSLVITERTTTF